VLFTLVEAAREHRPVAISYTSRDGRPTARTLEPYGIVAHSGHWYVTGGDSASGQVRTFRLDRLRIPRTLAGHFDVPDGFDAIGAVLDSLATTPWAHAVSVRVRSTAADLRARLPAGPAGRPSRRGRRRPRSARPAAAAKPAVKSAAVNPSSTALNLISGTAYRADPAAIGAMSSVATQCATLSGYGAGSPRTTWVNPASTAAVIAWPVASGRW
jgi:hypothetical protein